MSETRKIEGDAAYTGGHASGAGTSAQLIRHTVESVGSGTRTVLNAGNTACDWALASNDGTVGTWTALAAGATTTVTTQSKRFRCLGGRTTLLLTP